MVGQLGLMLRAQALSRLVRGHRPRILTAVQSRENLMALRGLVEAGKITPVIDRTFPLAETPDAIRYVETEHARAKVVITV